MTSKNTRVEQKRPISSMELARDFVAEYFVALGREDLSCMIKAGDGDDFAEVKVASRLLALHAAKIAGYESALEQYADYGFWDEAYPGGALALFDNGEMARNVLAGRPAFFHRD